MACRLPTLKRYRQDRIEPRNRDAASRQAFVDGLATDVSEMRARNIEELCHAAEFVNNKADETHRFLAECRDARVEPRKTMRRKLKEDRARIRADAERIVSTDFV